jgi:hypothetical protein
MTTVFSIKVSPLHPDLSAIYNKLGLEHHDFNSERKAIQGLKKQSPDIIVADFLYGYGNNYAGVNVCNLDVFFHSLNMQSPSARRIVFVEKAEKDYVEKLHELFPLSGMFTYPVNQEEFRKCLVSLTENES